MDSLLRNGYKQKINGYAIVTDTGMVFSEYKEFAMFIGYPETIHDESNNLYVGEEVTLLAKGEHLSNHTIYKDIYVVCTNEGEKYMIERRGLDIKWEEPVSIPEETSGDGSNSNKNSSEAEPEQLLLNDLWINGQYCGTCTEEYIHNIKLSKAILSYKHVEEESKFCIVLDLRKVLDTMTK